MKRYALCCLVLLSPLPLCAEENIAQHQNVAPNQEHLETLSDSVDANETALAGEKLDEYRMLLTKKSATFNLFAIVRGLFGLLVLMFIAWLLSSNRRAISWATIGKGLLIQGVIAFCVLQFEPVQMLFEWLGSCFTAILSWTRAGSGFLFGSLIDTNHMGFIFAFQVLPVIIFFSAITSLLFYLGVIQKVVWVVSLIFTKFMNLSGAESLATVGNIFLGQTESPLMVKAYIPNMTRSEIMLVMTAGMATMAGSVLAAYIKMLGNGDPVLELQFAKHLLSASVMAAPGAVVIAKILVPQTEPMVEKADLPPDKTGKNMLDAISNGTIEGLKLTAHVAAMLLTFYALIAGVNFLLGKLGGFAGLNDAIASGTDGRYQGLSLELVLGYGLAPLMALLGICKEDLTLVGQLLGQKIILTEFIGYGELARMIKAGMFTEAKSMIISTYILCGFANFASIGIQIGGLGSLAPNKRSMSAELGLRSLLGGTLAALVSATMVGMILG